MIQRQLEYIQIRKMNFYIEINIIDHNLYEVPQGEIERWY